MSKKLHFHAVSSVTRHFDYIHGFTNAEVKCTKMNPHAI